MSPNNNSAYGIIVIDDYPIMTLYFNDYTNTNIFYTEDLGMTWITFSNPAGTNSRGMDHDGSYFWISHVPNGIHRFQPGGVDDYMELSEISGQISGLTVFPYEGDTGIAVTTQFSSNIYMYRWNGTDLVYLNYGTIPQSGVWSLGLTYNSLDGNF